MSNQQQQPPLPPPGGSLTPGGAHLRHQQEMRAPSRGDTASRPRSGASPGPQHYGSLDRRRRQSGGMHPSGMGPSRMSPGPSIYRTMPLSPGVGGVPGGRNTPGSAAGRHTPSHLVRPIPQHSGGGQHQMGGAQQHHGGLQRGMSPFSPVTVPKINQSPVRTNMQLQL